MTTAATAGRFCCRPISAGGRALPPAIRRPLRIVSAAATRMLRYASTPAVGSVNTRARWGRKQQLCGGP